MNLDALKEYASRLQWLRGAVFAFATLSIGNQVLDLSENEILRALHAVLMSWSEWTGALFEYATYYFLNLPDFPDDLDAIIANSLLFYSTLASGILTARSARKKLGHSQRGRFLLRTYTISKVCFLTVGLATFIMIGWSGYQGENTAEPEPIIPSVALVYGFFFRRYSIYRYQRSSAILCLSKI